MNEGKCRACEICLDTGYYGNNGPGRKGNWEYVRCECGGNTPNVDKTCTTHHMCQCIQERLDRIEAVWQEHKHLDYLLSDKDWMPSTSLGHILHDLWRAIRREE